MEFRGCDTYGIVGSAASFSVYGTTVVMGLIIFYIRNGGSKWIDGLNILRELMVGFKKF